MVVIVRANIERDVLERRCCVHVLESFLEAQHTVRAVLGVNPRVIEIITQNKHLQ